MLQLISRVLCEYMYSHSVKGIHILTFIAYYQLCSKDSICDMTLANPFYQKFKSLPSLSEGDATSLWFSFALLFFRVKWDAFSFHIVSLSPFSISLCGHWSLIDVDL